jgi:hypothetical protein
VLTYPQFLSQFGQMIPRSDGNPSLSFPSVMEEEARPLPIASMHVLFLSLNATPGACPAMLPLFHFFDVCFCECLVTRSYSSATRHQTLP